VIVLAYDSADVLPRALASLRRQETTAPFETIVVWSGDARLPEIARREMPEALLAGRLERMPTGEARNAGLERATGEVVCFLAADCVAAPDWLARRLAEHRAGFRCVGGAVACGEPQTLLARSSHLLEYNAILPTRPREVVREQPLYNLSFAREIFEQYGRYEPQLACGEDTEFNYRLARGGEEFLFEPGIVMVHPGPASLGEFWRHQVWHGKGFASLLGRDGFPLDRRRGALLRTLVIYPAVRLSRLLRRVLRWDRRQAWALPVLVPFILVGIVGATWGLLKGWGGALNES
jgi:glycosyltransferase involved in cell wall biosynthesis